METHCVGKTLSHRNRITWKIPQFYKYPQDGCTLYSPEFDILNRSWHLFLRLGPRLDIGVYQVTKHVSDFKVRLGINRGDVEFSCNGILSCGGRGNFTLTNHAEIDKKREFWVPGGNLSIFFALEDTRISYSERASSQSSPEIGIQKLQSDLEFLLKGNVSDILVKVKDTEFQCHRCIMAARSPVFLAMVTHDTKENATGVIEIEDADPNVFSDFLHYLYTGCAKDTSMEKKVLDLYTLSDKYQVAELKNSCLDYMLENISMEKFCDFLALSLRHNEKKLTEACIQFFKEEWNSLEIIKTPEWQTFLSENPIACNELLIKLLENLKS